MELLPKLNSEDQKKLEDLVTETHKRHSRTLWRTRISVSLITALITSAAISIPVSLDLHDAINRSSNHALVQNCKSIGVLGNVERKVIKKAENTLNKQLNSQGKQKEEKQADIFYNWAYSQYQKVHCQQ